MDIIVPFDQLGNAINDDVEQNVRKVIVSIFAQLDSESPIGHPELWKRGRSKHYRPGWFKANWKVVYGPNKGDAENISKRGKGNDNVTEFKMGMETHIVNNVPYAERLGKGWSKQAPTGWILNAITIGIRNALRN